MRLKFVLILAFIMVSAGSAFAYRPFTTEDAGVTGKGVLQAEISYDFFKWKNGDTDQIFLLVSPIYGPNENLELSIETPFVIHSSSGVHTEGVGDINLVGKYVLFWQNYETKDAFLTLKGVSKLNTGDFEKGLGRGDIEYSLSPVATWVFNDQLTAHAQFGYTFVTNKKNPDLRDYYFYGLALDFAVTKPFHFVTEITCNENPDKNLTQQAMALAGITYQLNKHVILDTSFKKGIGKDSPDWGVGIGAAIEF